MLLEYIFIIVLLLPKVFVIYQEPYEIIFKTIMII